MITKKLWSVKFIVQFFFGHRVYTERDPTHSNWTNSFEAMKLQIQNEGMGIVESRPGRRVG